MFPSFLIFIYLGIFIVYLTFVTCSITKNQKDITKGPPTVKRPWWNLLREITLKKNKVYAKIKSEDIRVIYYRTYFHNSSSESIQKMFTDYSTVELILKDCRVDDVLLAKIPLENLRKLKKVEITESDLSTAGIRSLLERLPEGIEHLKITRCLKTGMPAVSINIGKFMKLKSIWLEDLSSRLFDYDAIFMDLSKLKKLEHVHLPNNAIGSSFNCILSIENKIKWRTFNIEGNLLSHLTLNKLIESIYVEKLVTLVIPQVGSLSDEFINLDCYPISLQSMSIGLYRMSYKNSKGEMINLFDNLDLNLMYLWVTLNENNIEILPKIQAMTTLEFLDIELQNEDLEVPDYSFDSDGLSFLVASHGKMWNYFKSHIKQIKYLESLKIILKDGVDIDVFQELPLYMKLKVLEFDGWLEAKKIQDDFKKWNLWSSLPDCPIKVNKILPYFLMIRSLSIEFTSLDVKTFHSIMEAMERKTFLSVLKIKITRCDFEYCTLNVKLFTIEDLELIITDSDFDISTFLDSMPNVRRLSVTSNREIKVPEKDYKHMEFLKLKWTDTSVELQNPNQFFAAFPNLIFFKDMTSDTEYLLSDCNGLE